MTVGYPDYSRLQRAGNFQLYDSPGPVPYNTYLFKGYVGLWPYVNLFTAASSTTDAARIFMLYYTDHTFTTEVAYRYAIRDQYAFGGVQYGNLTDWLAVYYLTKSGLAFPFTQFALYATNGRADNKQLSSLDVAPLYTNQSIPVSTTVTVESQHVQPGAALLSYYTNSASFVIHFQYFDYDSNGWQSVLIFNGTSANPTGQFNVAMLDCPMRIELTNNDTASRTFIASVASL